MNTENFHISIFSQSRLKIAAYIKFPDTIEITKSPMTVSFLTDAIKNAMNVVVSAIKLSITRGNMILRIIETRNILLLFPIML